jgi:hypothetical protein
MNVLPEDSGAFLGQGLRWLRLHRELLEQKRSLKKISSDKKEGNL